MYRSCYCRIVYHDTWFQKKYISWILMYKIIYISLTKAFPLSIWNYHSYFVICWNRGPGFDQTVSFITTFPHGSSIAHQLMLTLTCYQDCTQLLQSITSYHHYHLSLDELRSHEDDLVLIFPNHSCLALTLNLFANVFLNLF